MTQAYNEQVTFEFEWDIADLSADATAKWIAFPPWATGANIAWGNTGIGSPVGARYVHISNHGNNSSTKFDVYPGSSVPSVSGVASHVNLTITRMAGFVRLFYDVTSGGTGDVFTDDTEEAGTSATITFF